MENKDEKAIKMNIRKRVLELERKNYVRKPEGLKDREMVARIKEIIESEVGK